MNRIRAATAKAKATVTATAVRVKESWYVLGYLRNPKGKILSCYGLESMQEATEIAQRLCGSGLCDKIERVHTWKESARGMWKREVREYLL
jgi:hypothetical protein